MRTAGGWGWCVANMAFPGLNAAVLVSMSVCLYVCMSVCTQRPYASQAAKDELAGDRWRLWNLHGIDQSPDLKREFMFDSIRPKGSTQEFFTDTRENAPSRIAIYRRVPPANIRKFLSCPGSHQADGLVKEAIVKFHSSTNLGCVRNAPSPACQARPGRKMSLGSPFLVARRRPVRITGRSLRMTTMVGSNSGSRPRSLGPPRPVNSREQLCRCTACQLAKSPRASVPCTSSCPAGCNG